MDKKKATSYNFSSIDLLIYMWNRRVVLLIVGFVTAVASIAISLTITPMFKSTVVMFPASGASVARGLLQATYGGRYGVYAFGEEEQAEQLLQVLHSEPIRTRIIEKYDLMNHYGIEPDGKYPMTELLEAYASNVNFRLTEFMSVEISVMDADPVVSAAIANDIADLVDTVYNSMKRDRALSALDLVEEQYTNSEANVLIAQDSLARISQEIARDLRTSGGDGMNNFVKAFADYGVTYVAMVHHMRAEVGYAINMRYRVNEARLEAMETLPYKFVVERAVPAEKKAYPKKSLIVIVATFSALLFALIVMIVIDNIKARVAVLNEE
jgi:uncharacterized protein involved in exopolysaccharide biosynthesis